MPKYLLEWKAGDGPESLSTLSLRSADVGACDQEVMYKKINLLPSCDVHYEKD
jgi:hypothetical protein